MDNALGLSFTRVFAEGGTCSRAGIEEMSTMSELERTAEIIRIKAWLVWFGQILAILEAGGSPVKIKPPTVVVAE